MSIEKQSSLYSEYIEKIKKLNKIKELYNASLVAVKYIDSDMIKNIEDLYNLAILERNEAKENYQKSFNLKPQTMQTKKDISHIGFPTPVKK